jgi:hypothetical protein
MANYLMKILNYKYILTCFMFIFLIGCSSETSVELLNDSDLNIQDEVANNSIITVSTPVALTSTTAPVAEDLPNIITLNYSDPESRIADTCTISALANLTETTPCSCDISGVCTAGVTGTLDYNGPASFAYTVTVSGTTSNISNVNFTITPVEDPFYSTNFDTSADWTINGDVGWECGNQTNDAFGPPSGHSGNSVCGTSLNANYSTNNADMYLESPPITLTGAVIPKATFWLDNEIELSSCGADLECDGLAISINVNGAGFVNLQYSDGGLSGLLPEASVIGVGGPAGWSNTQPLGEWAQVTLDLFSLETPGLNSIAPGDTIIIRFGFHTDASGGGPGTYLDDFEVVETEAPTVKAYPYTQNFDSVDGWFATGGGNVWEIGNQTNGAFGPTAGHSGITVAATKLNATYVISGSTRHVDSYLTSPPLSLTGSSNPLLEFWYYNDSHVLQDGSNVQISVNNGPFITIAYGDNGFVFEKYTNNGNMNGLDGWSGLLTTWDAASILLNDIDTPGIPAITNSDTIRVRFLFHAGRNDSNYPGFYLDDFELKDLGGS